MTLPAATTTAHCEAILDEIERVVVGKRSALKLILEGGIVCWSHSRLSSYCLRRGARCGTCFWQVVIDVQAVLRISRPVRATVSS